MLKNTDKYFLYLLRTSVLISILIFLIIIGIIFIKTIDFFQQFPFWRFITELKWNIQGTKVHHVSLGLIPLINGTFMITILALLFSVPLGILAAIGITEFINKKYRKFFDVILEIAIGIPTIVYGYFGITFLSPIMVNFFRTMNIKINLENSLIAGVVLGIMLIPTIIFFTKNALLNVPKEVKLASKSLGATYTETIVLIALPHVKKNIITGIMMAILKALGETLIIIMLTNNNAKMGFNPLDSMTTITAQIINLINTDGDFNSFKTLATYALSAVLLLITITMNFFVSKMKD